MTTKKSKTCSVHTDIGKIPVITQTNKTYITDKVKLENGKNIKVLLFIMIYHFS